MNLEELKALFKETTFNEARDFEWSDYSEELTNYEGEKARIFRHVSQGSQLGSTLITFDDNYESSGNDAKLISELLRWLATQVK